MNDNKFEVLGIIKDELTIEDAQRLYRCGIVTVCEDGKAVDFDFECGSMYPKGA